MILWALTITLQDTPIDITNKEEIMVVIHKFGAAPLTRLII